MNRYLYLVVITEQRSVPSGLREDTFIENIFTDRNKAWNCLTQKVMTDIPDGLDSISGVVQRFDTQTQEHILVESHCTPKRKETDKCLK